ncbi:3-oxoadipate enol-lactonase [Natronospirillum operosum]|uniref:3-oxoadipate enol-lactonase n=1 Tax=Natronospirillum operosum TaxID=2759953 RepID=A0A4Z0WEN2_9GAMM|nr:3-oxoadipate enol-lactonase [Natronospirillum operosum]TGG93391.1 3-oxoadipate enol-lactonase [Natronospirillum operosum]
MYAVIANGIELHYELRNAGRPETLVFINSLGTDFRIWDDLAEHFPQFQILLYDKRGHGLSACPTSPYTIDDHINDLSQLLDALEIERATLCGVSVGGMIALGLCAREPERVDSLILSNTSYRIGNSEAWNTRISKVKTSGTEGLADTVMDRWFSQAYQEKQPELMTLWRNMLTATPAEGYMGTCAAIRDADLLYDARAIEKKTLVIAGSDDQATPPDVVEDLSEQINEATYTVVEGAGHLPCIEQPLTLSKLIHDFLHDPLEEAGRYQMGMRVRRSVLGAAHVDRAERLKTEFDAPFQSYITENAWGSVWSRSGLSKRDRSLLTIAMMASLGHEEELAMHIRATRNTGASKAEIQEVLLQVAVYAGVPAANTAIRVAKDVLVKMESENP